MNAWKNHRKSKETVQVECYELQCGILTKSRYFRILASQMTKRAAPNDVNWQLDPSLHYHKVYLEAETTFNKEFNLITL